MPVPQQKFREIVFQLLYSHDIGQAEERDMLALMMAELAVSRKVVRDAQSKMNAIADHLPAIDQLIAKHSHGYAFERIQSVERNILRLGIFELLYDSTMPSKVAIAEGLRLARKFGSPEGASFVNALLDTIYKESQGLKADEGEIKKSVEAIKTRDATIQRVIEQSRDDGSPI
jgi:transcription antitermination protein NusB